MARTDREILIELRRDVRYMKETMDREAKSANGIVKDHEGRLRILENFRWWLLGGVFASGGIGALVGRLIR